MTVYKISKRVWRLPIIISAAVVFLLALLLFSGLWTFERSTNFFTLCTVVLTLVSSWQLISLRAEAVIIDEQGLTYNRLFKTAKVAWEDIKEYKLVSSWASKPEVILNTPDIDLRIDYSCFDNSKKLLKDVRAHLHHLPMISGYDFTEV